MVSVISSYLGLILQLLGLYGNALECHKRSLAIDEELQNIAGMAMDYNNIRLVLSSQGNGFYLTIQRTKAFLTYFQYLKIVA